MNEEEIIEQFEHWIEYEKEHKDKINKADKLIEIQQGLLNLYEVQKDRINHLEDLLSIMEEYYSITIEDLENCIKMINRGVI